MGVLIFALVFSPVIAVSFVWCLVRVAWFMGRNFARNFAHWLKG